ncbi:MAG: 50S ribosomal protein L10 [Spirochaetaceae bacterium]|jgi:large subunit ribosomal protein L10|nr:50S ribosomal protein L10 [Spirochaetaceae bacterium]
MAIVAKKVQETKVSAIQELRDAFSGSEDFIFADYRGLTVGQITELRARLRGKEATFKVVKNNFARLAFEQRSAPAGVAKHLVGPTAVAITPRNANEAAKVLFDFVREAPALNVKGGLLGGDLYDAAQMEAFSKLPGKPELISMLMSVLNAPARNLAVALNDIPARLVRSIKAVGDRKGEATA